jgi:hypothetical protein
MTIDWNELADEAEMLLGDLKTEPNSDPEMLDELRMLISTARKFAVRTDDIPEGLRDDPSSQEE